MDILLAVVIGVGTPLVCAVEIVGNGLEGSELPAQPPVGPDCDHLAAAVALTALSTPCVRFIPR